MTELVPQLAQSWSRPRCEPFGHTARATDAAIKRSAVKLLPAANLPSQTRTGPKGSRLYWPFQGGPQRLGHSNVKTIFRFFIIAFCAGCAVAGIALLSGIVSWPANPDGELSAAPQPNETATVVYVIDGDTVDLKIGDSEERVRLIGIDTPETVNRNTPEQCFGAEASEALRELLPSGTDVRIVRDTSARDQYGRLLLYLYRSGDQLFINRWMIEQGYASAVSYRPNTTFEQDFASAELAAKKSKICLLYTSPSPRDKRQSRMPSSA